MQSAVHLLCIGLKIDYGSIERCSKQRNITSIESNKQGYHYGHKKWIQYNHSILNVGQVPFWPQEVNTVLPEYHQR